MNAPFNNRNMLLPFLLKIMFALSNINKARKIMLKIMRKEYVHFKTVNFFNSIFNSKGVFDSSQILIFFKDKMKYACFKLTNIGIIDNKTIYRVVISRISFSAIYFTYIIDIAKVMAC